jgi:hypothetical protein
VKALAKKVGESCRFFVSQLGHFAARTVKKPLNTGFRDRKKLANRSAGSGPMAGSPTFGLSMALKGPKFGGFHFKRN